MKSPTGHISPTIVIALTCEMNVFLLSLHFMCMGGSDYNPDAASSSSTPAITLSATQSSSHGSSSGHHGPGFR